MNKLKSSKQFGFTLIEIMVSISIFSLVLVTSMGSILSVMDANRKAQTLRNVMDNLNFALEGMTRTIRFGINYHCGSSGDLSRPRDCPSGDNSITVVASSGILTTYSFSDGRISKSENYGTPSYITSDSVTIESATFRVFGSYPYSDESGGTTDTLQPQTIIVITGYAALGVNPLNRTRFSIETTVSQRSLDFQ